MRPPDALNPDRGRPVLALLIVWAVVSATLLNFVLKGSGGDIVSLEVAGRAAAFEKQLEHWRESREATCGVGAVWQTDGPGLGTLRCNLFVDSVGLVPGYVGLLLLFTLGLARWAGVRHPATPHLACAPAVAAGLFDIAENGMTGRALEDWQRIVLADATVREVLVASLGKWALLALAFAVLAVLAWGAATRALAPQARWLQAAALLALAGALVLGAGAWFESPKLLRNGMGPGIVALALLAAWRWRVGPPPAA